MLLNPFLRPSRSVFMAVGRTTGSHHIDVSLTGLCPISSGGDCLRTDSVPLCVQDGVESLVELSFPYVRSEHRNRLPGPQTGVHLCLSLNPDSPLPSRPRDVVPTRVLSVEDPLLLLVFELLPRELGRTDTRRSNFSERSLASLRGEPHN